MRALAKIIVVLAWTVLVPAAAFAQATITGTVKDASGAVLPGVTVEASSEALIERVRSATTDATGQYRIVDLRAGTYTVTFALPGFNSLKREGVELTGSFAATVNADFTGGPFAFNGSYPLTVRGTFSIGKHKRCFRRTITLVVPPAAPGSGQLTTTTANPKTVTGAPFPAQPLPA